MTFDHTPPPNWVAERAKCRIDLTFDALSQIVERDVTEMNTLSARRIRNYHFTIETNDDGLYPLLRVRRYPEGNPDGDDVQIVTFERRDEEICIKADGKNLRRAHLKWHNASASCRLFVNLDALADRPMEVWELSQEYLGPLFFD